jgi:hypothetical protein
MAGLFALPVPRVGCDVVGFVDALFLLLDLFVAGALAWWGPGLIGQLVSFWDEVGNHVLGGTLCAVFDCFISKLRLGASGVAQR